VRLRPDPAPELAGPAAGALRHPSCTDGSEFGNPPGFAGCGTRCYVAKTSIGQLEQLAGPCEAIKPFVTPDQESLPETGASSTPSSPPPAGGADRAGGGADRAGTTPSAAANSQRLHRIEQRRTLAALARSYRSACRALSPTHAHRGRRAYHACLLAMARLAGGETRSATLACRHESRRLRHGGSDYGRCVHAGSLLLRQLAPHRLDEG
jgi:hypothetical protein